MRSEQGQGPGSLQSVSKANGPGPAIIADSAAIHNSSSSSSSSKHSVGLVHDVELLLHKHPARKHPESPERILAIMQELTSQGVLQRCTMVATESLEEGALNRVHSEHYLGRLQAVLGKPASAVAEEAQQYDSVFMNEHSVDCARRAAAGLISLTAAVLRGTVRSGVALIRPPGHHAEPHGAKAVLVTWLTAAVPEGAVRSSVALIRPPGHHAEPAQGTARSGVALLRPFAHGFCLLNNVATAAAWARSQGVARVLIVDWDGVARVLIVDWDVHHGNGTQRAFLSDATVMYCSLHRHDRGRFFPGGSDGSHRSVGAGAGAGYTVNVAWEGAGAGDAEYLEAMRRVVLPIAQRFQPQLVLVSAGFDACAGDAAMGGCRVTPGGFAAMTRMLMPLAGGQVVLALEGGYSLRSLGRCVAACCKALLGEATEEEHLTAAATFETTAAALAGPASTTQQAHAAGLCAGASAARACANCSSSTGGGANAQVSAAALRSISATILAHEPFWPGLGGRGGTATATAAAQA
ncbi:hypothetical protein JKP88DRAFT_313878 [Tribonema minus]|uniref:histone deacetylase n=1 Tax=Tribonema minus TaxID=303371 RepID=A0A835Z1R6_9STRA|nr:hypothetical protein JKP88DRAFT_313878 [Tribonema minus]